jgi:EcoRII C terminal
MTIRHGLLSELFTGVIAKRLTRVETITKNSNQHEFQGTRPFRDLFGPLDQKQIPTRFVWLSVEQEGISEDGFVTWSNVRKGKPRSPEYHLYYSGNTVTKLMKTGDTMFLARCLNSSIMIIIAPFSSTIEAQLRWLFGLKLGSDAEIQFRDIRQDQKTELDFPARYILNELGIEFEEDQGEDFDSILAHLNGRFPSTAEFSLIARQSLPRLDARDDPDATLMAWLEREEALFKRLERIIVSERINLGFSATGEPDVDDFIDFSLRVQNRRKSRAGHSLEHHLAAIFRAHHLQFEHGAITEGTSKPDFLFPSAAEYHNPNFPVERLTLLGSKSTCKDRWRQVLSEGKRVENKHLITLEPSISENQTAEMQSQKLRLVVPNSLHKTYRPSQQMWLMDIQGFLELIQERQIGRYKSY